MGGELDLYLNLQERACSGRRYDAERPDKVGIQTAHVIVHDHREHARSYQFRHRITHVDVNVKVD
jgi:hypothetical protein